MNTDPRKVCFVVMGFGKKTDYESGRTLDLDASYEVIIKPAAESAGLRCIRADEIMQSGTIDVEMYEMLLRADLVIADISTGNVNAIYELGVRHALRPNSTIVMKEADGRLYFDLDHTSTFKYEHLGADIGAREARRAARQLGELIVTVLSANRPDSPVYTYLPRLQQPRLTEEQYEALLAEAETAEQRLSGFIKAGEVATRASKHAEAAKQFASALAIKPEDPYLIQQLALNTYKTALPSKLSALIEARSIMARLSPDTSNDPETLGITGAIHKRIWLTSSDTDQLNLAIRYYSRGFEIRRDYYNGENLASCLDQRSKIQGVADEARYDAMRATKVRHAIVELLTPIVTAESFVERSDRRWVCATLANTYYALDSSEEALGWERRFLGENPAEWEIESYNEGKAIAVRVALERHTAK
jgi:tetratricopeptide (TPR) repeat protein